MASRIFSVSLLFLIVGCIFECRSQPTRIFQAAELNVQFQIPEDWQQIPRVDQLPGYELLAPDTTIHVILDVVDPPQEPIQQFLKQQIVKRKFVIKGDKQKHVINGLTIWTINATGLQQNVPVVIRGLVVANNNKVMVGYIISKGGSGGGAAAAIGKMEQSFQTYQ
jgi:hypothetical protein